MITSIINATNFMENDAHFQTLIMELEGGYNNSKHFLNYRFLFNQAIFYTNSYSDIFIQKHVREIHNTERRENLSV